MPDTFPAASQPAPQAQTSDAKTSDNRSGAEARSALLKGFIERQKAADASPAPAVETASPTPPVASTETLTAEVPESVTPEATAEPVVATTDQAPIEPAADDTAGETARSEDVLSHLSSLEPETRKLVEQLLADQKQHTQEVIEKKIGKERAMRGDLERELQALKAKTPDVVHVAAPTESNPLADVMDVQTLTTRHKEAKEAQRWAQNLLYSPKWPQVDGGNGEMVDAVKYGDQYLTRTDVRDILLKAQVALEDQIPARMDFLQKQQRARQAALSEFSFLKDKNSVEYQQAQNARKEYPWLNNVPEADWFIGAVILGNQVLEQRKRAATAAPATAPKLTPKAPPASQSAVPATSGAPRMTGDKAAVRALAADKEKLAAKGNVTGSEMKNYFLKREMLNRTT